MATLAQMAIPTLETMFDWGLAFAGILVFILLIYNLIKSRNTSPYLGMPMAVVALMAIFIALAGNLVDLSAYTGLFGLILGWATKIMTTALLYPFIMAAFFAMGYHIFRVVAKRD